MTIMHTLKGTTIGTALLALTTTGTASAATYSLGRDFGNPVFSYGYGNDFSIVTPVTPNPCFSILSCYFEPGGNGIFLANRSATDNTPLGGDLPAGSVLINTFGNIYRGSQFAHIAFTAPFSATWTIKGQAQRRDPNGLGLGVELYVPNGSGGYHDSYFLSPNSFGQTTRLHRAVIYLHAGQTEDFFLGPNDGSGDHLTRIEAEITSHVGGVPEPANWAMLMGGFGLVGVMARRRRVSEPVLA